MRGKERLRTGCRFPPGITPAHAGKSQSLCGRTFHGQDHPRACGEKLLNMGFDGKFKGSPPRMRGKGLWTVSKSPADRITPAHAGKSTRWLQSCRRRWDHPRACGEKFLSLVILLLRMGSPPRMRGKGARHMVTASARRITPAYAGKRPLFQVACSVLEDHPRVCGEKDQVTPGRGSLPGSPPRMRGKASNGGQQGPDARITPAYAGKSRAGEGGILCRGDHPRVCGEKWSLASWSVVFPGSPPRMRGKALLPATGRV